MIHCNLERESVNNFVRYKLTVEGHARSDDGTKGSVGVCGAVSCIVTTLSSYVENREYEGSTTEADGYAEIEIFSDATDTRLEEIILFVSIALHQVAFSYPEYVVAKSFLEELADKE